MDQCRVDVEYTLRRRRVDFEFNVVTVHTSFHSLQNKSPSIAPPRFGFLRLVSVDVLDCRLICDVVPSLNYDHFYILDKVLTPILIINIQSETKFVAERD